MTVGELVEPAGQSVDHETGKIDGLARPDNVTMCRRENAIAAQGQDRISFSFGKLGTEGQPTQESCQRVSGT